VKKMARKQVRVWLSTLRDALQDLKFGSVIEDTSGTLVIYLNAQKDYVPLIQMLSSARVINQVLVPGTPYEALTQIEQDCSNGTLLTLQLIDRAFFEVSILENKMVGYDPDKFNNILRTEQLKLLIGN
jgi:uncharacterized protein YlbG (UPF0298 family)